MAPGGDEYLDSFAAHGGYRCLYLAENIFVAERHQRSVNIKKYSLRVHAANLVKKLESYNKTEPVSRGTGSEEF